MCKHFLPLTCGRRDAVAVCSPRGGVTVKTYRRCTNAFPQSVTMTRETGKETKKEPGSKESTHTHTHTLSDDSGSLSVCLMKHDYIKHVLLHLFVLIRTKSFSEFYLTLEEVGSWFVYS